MDRDINMVIIKMMVEAESLSLRRWLYAILTSTMCASPEMRWYWWNELAACVNANLPAPDMCEDWQTRVANIFIGQA